MTYTTGFSTLPTELKHIFFSFQNKKIFLHSFDNNIMTMFIFCPIFFSYLKEIFLKHKINFYGFIYYDIFLIFFKSLSLTPLTLAHYYLF